MSSKYDEAWRRIFASVGGIESILSRVRDGEVVAVPAEELKKHGRRSSWSGRVVLVKDGVLGPQAIAAHVRALKNILPRYLLSNEKIECTMSSRTGQLSLIMRLANKTHGRPSVLVFKPSKTLVEPLPTGDLGNFYLLISSFERELRGFIKEMLGKGWVKRLEHELPDIVGRWKEREFRDIKWGIDPEEELINYADLSDYIQIIKRYRKIFAESDDELSDVVTQLKIFANYGRNPLMHCRTLDRQKYYTTQSAVKFLREWIKRRKNRVYEATNLQKKTTGKALARIQGVLGE